MNFLSVLYILPAIFSLSTQQDPQLAPLAPLASNVASVSGFSSGGAMAFSYYLSHSSNLRGCAIFSGLMYECGLARESEWFKMRTCSRAKYNYDDVVMRIEKNADKGLFDPLENLKYNRHYIAHGTKDAIVNIGNGNRMAQFFRDRSSDNQVLMNGTGSSHGYPTVNCGLDCPTVLPIAISGCLNCGWSGAFESLNYIYGGHLKPPTSRKLLECRPTDGTFEGLKTFDQREFFPPGSEQRINMQRTGYIYIPPQCEGKNASQCTLHLHIHGCIGQSSDPLVMTDYIKCTAIMAVAEANNIIVLFPQAHFSLTSISTVLMCWDFVGYTGKEYGTKKGSQIQAIKGMMDRVLGTYTRNNFK